ncbi:hypothetical protein Agabi119p4_335 [Agaricus bisporus var. burnettii]|uniref:non-specific serine/threonine protein kinase n=1 Tax=Agaricus bisporus var. burnettii TaxID=192524 RepID=A0A8H7FAB5_AGABI|nr:hypothetical protein Agabi119p4_335 [Agaricus bisporus var. burnettii]
MASQQPYHAYVPQNKGTLMSGQTISVNKYTVQVERYLSQGGFAQVYLVRTQAPVHNTTHHVLKHVVVANESMLTEVKKEVDVMRLLRGHPNIVYLIDAAWAKMPTGAFEVYILMEYCPGGGIIDMMNRRLRERLTEAEILQIFVEVCEGVAHMHHSRPPLLHRDLKVENILQSSSTSYKLCDFGSTAPITRPPTNSQEIRAVEADLNRHTTLQYRAPEMIDLHSRRPIDEKSDVWALGVLLYKLCYYTTPFEEHGPLAILNVQYRFPSYPVYSQQLTHLISSMLREQGAQRPTVFEVLAHVHKVRGTKSPFKYPLPMLTPLSPRQSGLKSNALDGVITYRQPAPQSHPSSVHPVQPVSQPQPLKLPEASTPERRGRPKPNVSPSSSTPLKPQVQKPVAGKVKLIDDSDFDADGGTAWKLATTRSASASNSASDEAWKVDSVAGLEKVAKPSPSLGFNDDFTQSLRVPMTSTTNKPSLTTPDPQRQRYSPKITPLPPASLTPNGDFQKSNFEPQIRVKKERDAFEGLGLMTQVSKPAPTLGEARKLRTGLAIVSTNISRPIKPSNSPRLRPKVYTPRASPIPPSRSSEPEFPSQPSSRPTSDRGTSSAESRFPSLEELDASFSRPDTSSTRSPRKQDNKLMDHGLEPPAFPPRPGRVGSTGTGVNITSSKTSPIAQNANGIRSEQATGVAVNKEYSRAPQEDLSFSGKRDIGGNGVRESFTSSKSPSHSRPLYSGRSTDVPRPSTFVLSSNANEAKPPPSTGLINHATRSRDLLTGDDGPELPVRQIPASKFEQSTFKIRDSPSKRASVIERNDVLEATIPQQGRAPSPPMERSPIPTSKAVSTPIVESPTVSRFTKSFPPINTSLPLSGPSSGLTENWSPIADTHPRSTVKEDDKKDDFVQGSSSEDEGPEEPIASSNASVTIKTDSQPKHKSRQSSVHDLVDLWGGGVSSAKDKQPESSVHPVSTPITRNAGVARHKSAFIPPRPSSPPRKASPIVNESQNVTSTNVQSPQGPTLPTSLPKSGRSRPQSMLIFPSKSNDSPSIPSPRLVSSDDPHPPPTRRTSISDMVQRFEAIQATARVSANATSSSPINPIKHTHLPYRDDVDQLKDSRPVKHSLDKIAVALPGLGTPSARSGDPIKRRTSLTTSSGRPPTFSSRRTSPISPAAPKSRADTDDDEIVSYPRSIPGTRREPIKLPVPARKPALTMEEVNKQSQVDEAVSTQSASVDGSASPDRPYQGVGKLIDQWQRISAGS